ncbi:MAG: fibronectin type III domain-containing protein, partial [Knoellia sp.]
FKVTPDGPGANKDLAAISLSWNTTSPNGPPLKNYTVKRRVNGGAWAPLKMVPASSTQATDQVQYDGRRYDYVVTATNGADLESPNSAVQSFTSIGIPSTPTVVAQNPTTNDERVRLTVNLGQPRAGSFTAVRWQSSDGPSGTFTCGSCPAGGRITITTTVLRTVNQSFTVTTDNGTHSSNPARSNAVQPYGPTPQPNPNGGSTSGQSVTFNWTLPTNGRPITRVRVTGAANHDGGPINSISASGGFSQDLTIHITAYSAGGTSPVLDMTRRTDNPPPPVVKVEHGPKVTGQSSCTDALPCYRVRNTVSGFQGGTVSCTAYSKSMHPAIYGDYNDSWTQGDGTTRDDSSFLGWGSYDVVTVTCTKGALTQTDSVNWRY